MSPLQQLPIVTDRYAEGLIAELETIVDTKCQRRLNLDQVSRRHLLSFQPSSTGLAGVVARLIDPAPLQSHRFKRPLRSIRAGWLGRAGDPAAEPRGR